MVYLERAADLFDAWKASKRTGLTAEIFLACSKTTSTLPLLATHLIDNHGFQYVLLGKFMSDPIEARFGWYRQMNGGNFIMSLRQLLDSEKKIQVLGQLERCTLSRMGDEEFLPLPAAAATAAPDIDDVTWLCNEFSNAHVDLDSISDSDANIIHYVAGYIGRSVSRQLRCSNCKSCLVSGPVPDELEQSITEDVMDSRRTLLDMADRGGLASPTDICFSICSIGYLCYNVLTEQPALMKRLMLQSNQRSLYISSMIKVVQCELDLPQFVCSSGHHLIARILACLFNCLSKNELKRMNNTHIETGVSSRKVKKIRSEYMCK